MWLDWDWQGAEKSFLRALELNPNSALVHSRYSVYLSSMARHDEAVAEVRRARELDPTSVTINQTVERTFYFARRYDEALAVSDKTLELDPNAIHVNSWREMSLAQKGRFDAAIELRLNAMKAVGVEAEKIENIRKIYQVNGWQGFWRHQADISLQQTGIKYISSYNLARNYARAGDIEKALSWLEQCEQERSDHLTLIKVNPIFDNLRDNPRFAALLNRIGLG